MRLGIMTGVGDCPGSNAVTVAEGARFKPDPGFVPRPTGYAAG